MPFLILELPTPLNKKDIWTKESNGTYDYVDDKKIILDKQEHLIYKIWGGAILVIALFIYLFGLLVSDKGIATSGYIGILIMVGISIPFFIYGFTAPQKWYVYNREQGLITFPEWFYKPDTTLPFTKGKFTWFGNGGTSGALRIELYVARGESKKGALLVTHHEIGEASESWSFIVWYMDKNRSLPPGDAFDAYREADFERRKAEGFSPPLLFKIPFNVKKGSSNSKDDDGIINIKLSNNKGFKIVNSTEIKTKYGSIIEVEIEIDAQEKVDTYLNFYSSDNKDDTWNAGEYENVYCGCFKLTFDYCVCTDWSAVAPIIPKGKFIGWGHTGITQNCYHYSLEQLRQAGHWVKSERWNKKWDGTKEVNDHIYQIFLETDVAGMTKGVQKDQFKKGVEYLKKTIKNKIPVMVGVDDDVKLSNDDETTEHFVVIVGMGSDTNGNYFLFYDNAVPNSSVGASSDNKLYCKCKDSKLEGTGSLLNRYIQINTSKKKYVVTQIRETK
ncbi:hypothetical protein A8C32_10020 [Flavivirga aquatica]|uniref:Uncharacterized protein n=2 Tax=Flavivirga aquatica TaxID=1849968 RepID=A0A1E5TES1_9FLAO|nr:hypothetical protein A8C32_10020 [Flavivirga aquatica]